MRYLKLIVFLLFAHLSFSQTDFNRYQPLISKGEMPDDFKLSAQTKIQQNEIEVGNLSKKQQTEFLERIHYGFERLLNSGAITYGDAVSSYLSSIADNLLKEDPQLRSKLRIYTLKSTTANAFATNQGIIVFTTALLAQLSSEAQLAYVLAHEITHFKNNHVVQSYEKQNEKNSSVAQMSKYSKEHEFEADREAIELCYKAGYDKQELLSSFDVLLFSHLPFDEFAFDKTYYNSENFFIPEFVFPTKHYEVNMDEDYNDSLSTHPNIAKRKTEVEKTIESRSNWGTTKFTSNEDKFYEIRNICRFETIRTRIVNGEIPYALYEIFILEKSFPNSEYLQSLKAHAWYDLARLRNDKTWKNVNPSKKTYEGESAKFFEFIYGHTKEQTNTFALRTIYDAHKLYPENEYIGTIYRNLVKLLTINKILATSGFHPMNYQNTLLEIEKNKAEKKVEVTAEKPVEEKEQGTKYSRIRNKTSTTENGKVIAIDSVNYHRYGIVDILQDQSFLSLFDKLKAEDAKEEGQLATTTKSKKQKRKEANSVEITSKLLKDEKIILTQPLIVSAIEENNAKRAAELEPMINKALDYALDATNRDYVKVGGKNGQNLHNTKTYNQNAFFYTLLLQSSDLQNHSLPIVPIDFDQSQLIMSQLGATKIAYIYYGERSLSRIRYGKVFGFIWFPPVALMNLIKEVGDRHSAMAAIYTIDLHSGVFATSSAVNLSMKPSKIVLESAFYNLLNTK